MKASKITGIVMSAMVLLGAFSANAKPKAKAKAELCQAVFVTDVDCAACVKKVTENISFEKGVKDLEVKLEGGTVRVVYDSKKTDAATLEKAIQKLGYKTELKEDKKL